MSAPDNRFCFIEFINCEDAPETVRLATDDVKRLIIGLLPFSVMGHTVIGSLVRLERVAEIPLGALDRKWLRRNVQTTTVTMQGSSRCPISAPRGESRSSRFQGARSYAHRVLLFLEPGRFLRATRGVAGAIGMSAGSSQLATIHDQILRADRTILKPAFQYLPGPGGITGLRRQ